MSDSEPKTPKQSVESTSADSKTAETSHLNESLEPLKSELDELRREHKRAQAKIEENWNLFLRARAEMENVQRRSRLDLENAHKFAIEKFAKELLAVVDSFELGLESTQGSKAQGLEQAMADGMNLTFKLLLDTLEKFGVKSSNPIGEVFNPAYHEALSMQVSANEAPNKVIMVAQKGFTLADRLLRPARVIVSKAPEATKVDEEA